METKQLGRLLGLPRLPDYLRRVEQRMLDATVDSGSLQEPLRYTLKSGGKRLRPILTIYVAASTGRISEPVIKTATAVELVHLASLVHDDMLDQAAKRRSAPSVSQRFGPGTALLCGDYLIALAIIEASSVSPAISRLISETVATMAQGEALSLNKRYEAVPANQIYIHGLRQKTASLFKTACILGGMSANLPKSELAKLGSFGEEFGIAYQIIDDLVDNDIPKKLTAQALTQIKRHNTAAAAAVKNFGDGRLSMLPDYYLDWALAA